MRHLRLSFDIVWLKKKTKKKHWIIRQTDNLQSDL